MAGFGEQLGRDLDEIRDAGLWRELREIDSAQTTRIKLDGREIINFSSNDYLGLAGHPALGQAAREAVEQFGVGSGASRLICGSLQPHHALEAALAKWQGTESALVFSTGFAAAQGVLTSLLGLGDVVILDAHCPHLGAHLGHGGCGVGESIRCPFHHWEFDGSGACAAVPYAKRIPARARLATCPVVEKNGLILFHHDRDGAEPTFEVPDVPEIGGPGWTELEIMRWSVRAHWLDMNENHVAGTRY